MAGHAEKRGQELIKEKITSIFGKEAIETRETHIYLLCPEEKLTAVLECFRNTIKNYKNSLTHGILSPHIMKVDFDLIGFRFYEQDIEHALNVLKQAEPTLRHILGEEKLTMVERHDQHSHTDRTR